MAGPINTPVTTNIGHLSGEDLFAPLPEKTRLGGPGPFVINLTVSTAPIDLPGRNFDAGRDAYVYQVQRTEDRRLRYRLRLGTFASEDDADAVLEKVRDIYPAALTATADPDDLRSIAALQSKTGAQRARAAAKAAELAAAMKAVTPAAPMTVAAEPAPMVLSLVEEPPITPPVLLDRVVAPRVATPGVATPGVATPGVATPPARAAAPTLPMNPAPATKAVPVTKAAPVANAAPDTKPVPRAKPAPPALKPNVTPANVALDPKKPSPSIQSTQTVRALSELELKSDQASQWFVIQLSLSEQAFDSETVPNLDIFSVYRLYSVAGIDQGRIVHALRLGFFAEGSAAAAVASYLSAYYDKPTVKRVSTAERDRFVDQVFQPRKDVGATGKHAVIEITNERYVREKRKTNI
jgi:hypothetical protein